MIDNIGKQAVTIHVFIDKIQGTAFWHHEPTHKQVQVLKKIVNKFLRNMKNSEYYYLSSERYGDNYYQNIENHLDRKQKKEYQDPVYLTWIQYQFHSFICDVFPAFYDKMFRVKGYEKFYKSTLEILLR